jgi:hypothetical protein
MAEFDASFWSKSLRNSRDESISAISTALARLIESTQPGLGFPSLVDLKASSRIKRHLTDFISLNEKIGEVLPVYLASVRDLLQTSVEDAINSFLVYFTENIPRLSPWQNALVQKLNADSDSVMDDDLMNIQNESLNPSSPFSSQPPAKHIQENLFLDTSVPMALNASVQWIAARDYLEEIEVVAGMIQKELASSPQSKPSDIGLLLPNDSDYLGTAEEVFIKAGLSLSGLPKEIHKRDLGHEAVLYFLMRHEGPVPAMVLAALLSSPLMPWSPEDGENLAQLVMKGDFRLRAPSGLSSNGKQILKLIRESGEDETDLAQSLSSFKDLLTEDDVLSDHLERAHTIISDLIAIIFRGEAALPWDEMRLRVSPISLTSEGEASYSQEGISIFIEDFEAWRKVNSLYILGFSAGRYPKKPGTSPVFSEMELSALQNQLGLELQTGSKIIDQRRSLLVRQLRSASENMTFFIPCRKPMGEELFPSETLTFMAKLFSDIKEPENLILNLDSTEDRAKIRGLSLAQEKNPSPLKSYVAHDLVIKANLLDIRKGKDGNPIPESPSSLETLVVSPFAWLLNQLQVESKNWEPEKLGPLNQGSLAHMVFEGLFSSERPIPQPEEISPLVQTLLEKAIRSRMPILQSPAWRVERQNLQSEIENAALGWRNILEAFQGQILGNELWLEGVFEGYAIHGGADSIVSIPGDRIFVVDFKKSRSPSRQDRMEKGYDIQASLYRQMLKTGGPKKEGDETSAKHLEQASEIGVLYFTMNDQTALTDTSGWSEEKIPGVVELSEDISNNGIELVKGRLGEISQGIVKFNRAGDTEKLEKVSGIKPYAIDNSPLIGLFTQSAPDGGDGP